MGLWRGRVFGTKVVVNMLITLANLVQVSCFSFAYLFLPTLRKLMQPWPVKAPRKVYQRASAKAPAVSRHVEDARPKALTHRARHAAESNAPAAAASTIRSEWDQCNSAHCNHGRATNVLCRHWHHDWRTAALIACWLSSCPQGFLVWTSTALLTQTHLWQACLAHVMGWKYSL